MPALKTAPLHRLQSAVTGENAVGDRRTDQTANQAVARRRGKPQPPGEQIPGRRARQARPDDGDHLGLRNGDDLADGVGHLSSEEDRARHVEHPRQQNRLTRRGTTGGHQGGNRVGRIMEAVGQGEREREADGDDQPDLHQ